MTSRDTSCPSKECLALSKWVDDLACELGLSRLEPTTENEIPRSRSAGMDTAKVVRALRDSQY